MQKFSPNKKLQKTFNYAKIKSLSLTEKDKSIILDMMPGKNYDLDKDIMIFEGYLANNIKDRDGERFPIKTLKAFEKTIVGKKSLLSHNWGHPGIGKVFKARIETMTVDEAIEFIGGHPEKNFKAQLTEIASRDNGIHWLVTTYYVPNVTPAQQEIAHNIATGTWDSMSIGFRSPALYAIYDNGDEEKVSRWYQQPQDEKRKLLYLEYRSEGQFESEAVEQSLVGVPAQYGAGTKDYNDDDTDIDMDSIDDPEIAYYLEQITQSTGKVWTIEYINKLPDMAFAIVEPGEKDGDGKTVPRSLRHLPHHTDKVKDAKENDTVDLVHLRNALARVSQIQAVTDKVTTASIRRKAKSHLIAHAKALGVGDYDKTINKRSNSMNFKNENLGINFKIDEEHLEDSLALLTNEVTAQHVKSITEKNLEIEKCKIEIEKMKAEIASIQANLATATKTIDDQKTELGSYEAFKGILGVEFTIDTVKKLKEQADAYRENLINEAIKFGCLAGIIENTPEVIEKQKIEFKSFDNTVVEFWLKKYKEITEKQVNPSQIPDSNKIEEKIRKSNFLSM